MNNDDEMLADLRALDPAKAAEWDARLAAQRAAMRSGGVYYRPDPDRPSKKDWPEPSWIERLLTRVFG